MKTLNLKNQFIMAPIKLGYSDKTGVVTQRHLNFYKERSKFLGAITLEPLYMDQALRELPTQLGINNDDKIKGLKSLTDLIHADDTKVIAHLNHPGRMANPKIPGNYFWSSSAKACEVGGASPEVMDSAMMQKVVALFIESSKRAVQAGFDIVELQFGHGYLPAQFISPDVNNRTDEYGGSFENRIRFPLEIAKAVRQAVAIPIIARISADEMFPAGFHLDDMLSFSSSLEDIGLDAIHVSTGSVCSTPPWYFQHMFVPKGKSWELAFKIKEQLKIPVVFVGKINTVEDIDSIHEKYHADYIALGRSLVADANFVGKYLKEMKGSIRPCLACSDGCLGGVKQGKGLGCLVNPLVNASFSKLEKSKEVKYFAVVGGGLAGMEAALTLTARGHGVAIFEKGKLGGQFNLAVLPPKKQSLQKLIDYYSERLADENISIIPRQAKVNDFPANYDAIILATGSLNFVPALEGLAVYSTANILEDLPTGKNIVVIGGGLIGLETAHALAKKKNKVSVIETLEEPARGMEMIEKKLTLKSLKEDAVPLYTETKVVKIEGSNIYLEGKTSKILENIDIIVISTGMKSHVPLKEELDVDIPVYVVGDAKKVGKAQDAISDAYELALSL